MTERRLPEPTNASEQKTVDDVREHGWHVIHVLPEGDTPGWSFTIGLHHSFGHAEVVVFGLPAPAAHALLNLAGAAVLAGRQLVPDVPHDDFLEGYRCVLRPVDVQWYPPFVGYAMWFYQGEPFPLLQLFWPDRESHLPWEPEATPWLQANQPLLYEHTAEAARAEALLSSLEGPT